MALTDDRGWAAAVDRIVEVASGPDGGVHAVGVRCPLVDGLRRCLVTAAERLGVVLVEVGTSPRDLPPAILHRHVLMICPDAPARSVAINWVRALAQVSPRRHVVACFSCLDAEGSQETADPHPPLPLVSRVVAARLRRAARWLRRGRPSAAAVGVMALLRTRDLDWPGYAEAAALHAEITLARGEAASALAWLRSVVAEAWLREVSVPARISGCLADAERAVEAHRVGEPGAGGQMTAVEGVTGLLKVMEDADDEMSALVGGCQWVRRQCGADAVGIVSADATRLIAAQGWKPTDLSSEIARILAGPARDVREGRSADDRAFGVSIRYGGITLGHVVARGGPTERPVLREAAQVLAAVSGSALRARLETLTLRQQARDCAPEILGTSPLITEVRDAIARTATTTFPVLVEGESGTGKELVARALHRLSPRRDHRFMAVNCAALSDDLVEAELFGHTRGAFTGAVGTRAGLFEDAHQGTVFLDEVSELSARAQAKLLRVLQEREIRRVGENTPRRVDVRAIAATNLPLADAVASGRFRDDLRFRLAVVRIRVPPLRDRLEDLPLLVHVFWRRAQMETGKRAVLGPDALAQLARHPWPGNVRELQNVVAGLAVAAPVRGRVTARHVAHVITQVNSSDEDAVMSLEAARRLFERRVVAATLARHAGRRTAAAQELGLTRQGLTKALRRLGLASPVDDEEAAGVA